MSRSRSTRPRSLALSPRETLSALAALTALAVAGGAAGCGGAQDGAGTAPQASASASASPKATPTTWTHGMAKDQQVAFMMERVVPAMATVFKEHDAKEFASFGCKTCHGPDKAEPEKFLPRLTMKDGKLTAFEEHPAEAKWMAEKVVPAMAAAMGMQPYDPATKQGFGCKGCHAIDVK